MTYLQILNELSVYLEERIESGEDFNGILQRASESVWEGKNLATTSGDIAAEKQFKMLHNRIEKEWKQLNFSTSRSVNDEAQWRILDMLLKQIKHLQNKKYGNSEGK